MVAHSNIRCKGADGKFIKTSLCENENCPNRENHPKEKLQKLYTEACEKASVLGICGETCHSSKCEKETASKNSDFNAKQAVLTAIGIVLVILVFIGLKSL